jgi:hypothetical protein
MSLSKNVLRHSFKMLLKYQKTCTEFLRIGRKLLYIFVCKLCKLLLLGDWMARVIWYFLFVCGERERERERESGTYCLQDLCATNFVTPFTMILSSGALEFWRVGQVPQIVFLSWFSGLYEILFCCKLVRAMLTSAAMSAQFAAKFIWLIYILFDVGFCRIDIGIQKLLHVRNRELPQEL